MNNNRKPVFFVACLLFLAACSKMDEYKDKYITNNSEIIYTGKVDSLKIRSGKNRVQVNALLAGDPRVSACRIYWDNKADSVTVAIDRTKKVDTLRHIITGIAEGRHTFEVITFDVAGNRSVTVSAIGAVYGDRYAAGLLNRPVASSELLGNGNAIITWGEFDITSGARGTLQTYTDLTNKTVEVYRPVQETVTTLANYKPGTKFAYRTVYLPDSSAIDTFYTASQTMGVREDVTVLYMRNAGPNFNNSAGGTDRWRTPADWVTTADVRNAGGIGGLDAGSWLPSVALSIEAGWGLPAVNNGKIYQAITLPAGKYLLDVVTGDCSDAGDKFISIALGDGLPDIGNVATGTLAYRTMTKFASNTLAFELASASTVSIGTQAKLPDTGTFLKIFTVRLYSMP